MDSNQTPSEKDRYWFDRLDRSYDKEYTPEQNKKAIEYFHAKKELPAYLLTPEKSFDLKFFPKSMWEDHLKVLVKWINKEEVKEFFCTPLYDRLCDFPFEDAGTECTDSAQCTGLCLADDVECKSDCKGTCATYRLNMCDNPNEVRNATVHVETIMCD